MKKCSAAIAMMILLTTNLVFAKDDKKDILSEEQKQLNYGYAILYLAFDGLQWADNILVFKSTNDDIKNMAKEVNDLGKKMVSQFDELQKNYPNLRYDDTGRPEVLMKKNKAQIKDSLWSFFPIFGEKGPIFERSFLLLLSNTLGELVFLSEELQSMEPNQGLKDFLGVIHNETKQLNTKAWNYLNTHYFVHNDSSE